MLTRLFFILSLLVSSARADVAPAVLAEALGAQLARVPEIQFVRELAEAHGVRAWLFGGTAAAYAHYVKWDLERKAGDERYSPLRFDYDYFSLFRPNQDFDLVIDGNADVAEKIEAALGARFRYLSGNRPVWEVRLLREARGTKAPLLGATDFHKQHSDSNSTGLVEITAPPASEARVRDVRDWRSKAPHFLRDVCEGKLHYYFSPAHEHTERYLNHLNPPILSVVRYFTKAFQYGLEMRPEDLARIKDIVDKFDPESAGESRYVHDWIERNGRKLVQNASNLEVAFRTLDQVGLRAKLAATSDTLARWLNKAPLPTFALGEGEGRTAAELKLTELAHETSDVVAYESITRSPLGHANVFLSRPGQPDEAAAHGEGFYTLPGRKGARGTGLTIRFRLDPRAREGTDFTRTKQAVLVHNKAAITVIPETLPMSVLEYLRLIAKGIAVPHDDLALLERWRRKAEGEIARMTAEEREQVETLIAEEWVKGRHQVFQEAVLIFRGVPASLDAKLQAVAEYYEDNLLILVRSPNVSPEFSSRILQRAAASPNADYRRRAYLTILGMAHPRTMPSSLLWDAFAAIPLDRFPKELDPEMSVRIARHLRKLENLDGPAAEEMALKYLHLATLGARRRGLTYFLDRPFLSDACLRFFKSPLAVTVFVEEPALRRMLAAGWKRTGALSAAQWRTIAGGFTWRSGVNLLLELGLTKDTNLFYLKESIRAGTLDIHTWHSAMDVLRLPKGEQEALLKMAFDATDSIKLLVELVEWGIEHEINARWFVDRAMIHTGDLDETHKGLYLRVLRARGLPPLEKFRYLVLIGSDEALKAARALPRSERARNQWESELLEEARGADLRDAMPLLRGLARLLPASSPRFGDVMEELEKRVAHATAGGRPVPVLAHFFEEVAALLERRQYDPRIETMMYHLAFADYSQAYAFIVENEGARDRRYLELLVHRASVHWLASVAGKASLERQPFAEDELNRWIEEIWRGPAGKKSLFGLAHYVPRGNALLPEIAAEAHRRGDEDLIGIVHDKIFPDAKEREDAERKKALGEWICKNPYVTLAN